MIELEKTKNEQIPMKTYQSAPSIGGLLSPNMEYSIRIPRILISSGVTRHLFGTLKIQIDFLTQKKFH